MHKLTSNLEIIMSKKLPESFAIFFDGCLGGDTHFVNVYETFLSDHARSYEKFLLALSPMEHEEKWNANEIHESLQFVLGVFGKKVDIVVAVVGENLATNGSMSRRIGLTFIGCHSHRYNLAILEILAEHNHVMGNAS